MMSLSRKSFPCRICVEIFTTQYNEVYERGGLCPLHESVGAKRVRPLADKPKGRGKKIEKLKKKKTS